LRCVFLRNSSAIANVTRLFQYECEIIEVSNNDNAYEKIKNGEADAFFTVDVTQAEFEDYDDVVISDFFPLILNPVSFSTQNPDLAPVVSVVQKALDQLSGKFLQHP